MSFDNYKDCLEERWEGMIDIIEEKALNDYALGRAMIKFSQSENPINKQLQKHGMKQAKKYEEKKLNKRKAALELIVIELDDMILKDAKQKGKKISGNIVYNETDTIVTMRYKFDSYDTKSLNKRIGDVLSRNQNRDLIYEYEWYFNEKNDRLFIKIKI